MDILCLSSSDWHGKWGSRQQVMLRFARRGYRVLFVERQVGVEHLWRYPEMRRRKWRRWREGLHQLEENLWIVSFPPLMPSRYYSLTIAHWNQRLVERWAQPHLKRLGFREPILWMYRPEDGGLIGRFGERLAVYHCIDEFAAGTQGRKRRLITALEQETLRKADIVFANSRLTYSNKRAYNPNTYRIPSGVDVAHFAQSMDAQTEIHPAMARISHPIAGYVGSINEKLDIALLTATARKMTEWQFVFVGQVYRQTIDLSVLESLPNTHFLGRYPFEDIPALMKAVDICLLPYADTEYTYYRSPLKLYEYLAAGKPIVSTDHPEVREFAEWVKIAGQPQAFADAIVKAYRHHTPDERQRRADLGRQHSWDRRVDEMERHITILV